MRKAGCLTAIAKSFLADRRGNVMMLFGLALVPIMGVIGVTVDYGRASRLKQSLSAAIDAAALMAARDAPKLTDAQLTDRVNNWLKDNLPDDAKAQFTGATVSIDRAGRTVNIVANGSVPTTIAQVLGTSALDVSTSSQSTWGTNSIELALVLDNTGSMAQNGKMTALKAAAKDLVQIMKEATQEQDQIRISIVPFSTRVILDTALKDSAWLRWDQKSCSKNWPYTCTTISKPAWQGCVTDRDQSYDVSDTAPSGANATLYPADFCDTYSPASQARVMGLTSDWNALNTQIDTMQPTGATNITIGAVWGMATLSPGEPFTGAKPANTPRLNKYMILLTDGDNTKNRWDGNGSSLSTAVDDRTKLACTNIKSNGVLVYTIRVMDGNATLLRNCASTPGMYYEVTAASQLSPIFKAIAAEISQVRLTQ